MRWTYNETKSAQVAARLLRSAGGTLPYLSLIKLMYMADRKALIETGLPITGDQMVAMPKGPVLSKTYDNITTEDDPANHQIWFDYISAPSNYSVSVLPEAPTESELSDYEDNVLDEVFEEFGHRNQWALVEYTHTFPEWKDPQGSSFPITPEEILRASGQSEDLIQRRVAASESLLGLQQMIRQKQTVHEPR